MKTPRILFLQSLILLLSFAGAQLQTESTDDSNYYVGARISSVAAIITVVLLSVAFLLWLFWHYNYHYTAAPAMRVRRGLGDAFPTFTYAEVKEHKIGKSALECAVCLSEFEDHETLRLIPKCNHVFHPECIDPWLESNVTCPVCRANLTPQTGGEPVHPLEPGPTVMEETNSRTGEIVIQIEGDDANPSPAFYHRRHGRLRSICRRLAATARAARRSSAADPPASGMPRAPTGAARTAGETISPPCVASSPLRRFCCCYYSYTPPRPASSRRKPRSYSAAGLIGKATDCWWPARMRSVDSGNWRRGSD